MAKKKSYLTATDQFCGAGGSGQGIKKALDKVGGEIKLGLNHWKLATETYSTNFENTLVDCTDISACDPRRYPSTNFLFTSPECTTHSPAGGNNHRALKKQMDMFNSGKIDPATERSRATMWDVCRFAEYHQYDVIVAENVVEAKTRWPLFDDWLRCMHTLGYSHHCCYLNSMHFHPTPQSRDRMYVVFWKKNNKKPNLEFYPLAYCFRCEKNVSSVQTWKRRDIQFGKYRKQYVYCCPNCTAIVDPYFYASFNVIDWNDLGTRISDRKIPLRPDTTKRIKYGLAKYENKSLIIHAGYGSEARGVYKSVYEPLFTQATGSSQAIVNPPFIIKGEHSKVEPMVKNVLDALQVQTTRQTFSLLVPPMIVEMFSGGKSKETIHPLNTQTTREKTGLLTHKSWNSFISSYYGGSNCTKHITEEMGTLPTVDRHTLLTYEKPVIEDCFFRMLKPDEIKLGMGFNAWHKILGNSKERVKQCGNAVTPPTIEAIADRCIESLN